VLPDSGNPLVVAGLCWWKDYAPLLDEAGLLRGFRKAKCSDVMAFGDSPGTAPLFVALQVPLWYKCRDGGAQLVFTNICVVSNEVGLLDGRYNMEALDFVLQLSSKSHRTTYSLRGRPLCIADTGSHLVVRLAKPRKFLENERGLAVTQPKSKARFRASVVEATPHYGRLNVDDVRFVQTYAEDFS
jgi:hypothetical protein